jgi:electron transfer flavoprotein beta subunit
MGQIKIQEGDIMRIVVCIKQVPDTHEVKIDPETNTLIRTGIPVIINPDDKNGIEAALKLREQVGGSTVTVISMGPPQAEMALREALSMGCDEAVLISGREFAGSDTLATSTILSAALEKVGFDLIITGRQAIDGDTAQVGPQIAELLGIPQASYVESITPDGGSLIVMRQFEDRYHKLRINLPCLLTAIKELNEPRFMTVSGITAAQDKEVQVMDYDSLSDVLNLADIGLKGSPTSVISSFTKEPKALGTLLNNLTPAEAVDAIMARMHESHLI